MQSLGIITPPSGGGRPPGAPGRPVAKGPHLPPIRPNPSGQELVRSFRETNPHFTQPEPFAPPDPVNYFGPCNAERVVLAGGQLSQLLTNPTWVPFEQLYRKLPVQGIFNATPERPEKISLGSFTVPGNMALLIIDYRFDIYRLSGIAAGDTAPIEARRLSTLLGYKWNITSHQSANIRMEIDPVTPADQADAFAATTTFSTSFNAETGRTVRATQAEFNLARTSKSSQTAGGGLSLLPQRTERLGALQLPFMQAVTENDNAEFQVIVFRPVPIPIAFFELDVTGLLVPYNTFQDLMRAMEPCQSPGGGV